MYCNVEYTCITTSNWRILFTVQYIAQLYIVQLQDKNHIQPITVFPFPGFEFTHVLIFDISSQHLLLHCKPQNDEVNL